MKEIFRKKAKNMFIKSYIASLLIICMVFLNCFSYYAQTLNNLNSKDIKVEFINVKEKIKTGGVKKIEVDLYNNLDYKKNCKLILALCDSNDKNINIITSCENIKGKKNSKVTSYVNVLPQVFKVKAFAVDELNNDQIISNVIEIPTTNPVIVEGISNIEDLEVEVNKGEKYILPNRVSALMSSGKLKEFPVKWNGIADTSKEGRYDFEGTVEGYSKKINLVLKVKLVDKIEKIEDINISLMQNDIYNLPKEVSAFMNTGITKYVPVKWNIDKINTNVPGKYTYEGTIEGYDKKIHIVITIASIEDNKPIIFKNKELESVIRDTINIYDEDIYKKDLESITKLYLSYLLYEDTNIEDLRYLSNLRELDLSMTELKDINVLSNLTNLENLSLFSTGTTDITALKNLGNLKVLNLGQNKIKDIESLKNLFKIESLNLTGNNITNLTPLANMNSLKKLKLAGNDNIKDYSPTAKYYDKLEQPDFQLKLHKADSNKVINYTILKGDSFTLPLAVKIDFNGVEKKVFVKWNTEKVNTNVGGNQSFYGTIDGSEEKLTFNLTVNALKDDDIINFPDKKLEMGIRKAIDKPHGEIYRSDVKYLKNLDLSALGVENLTGIENLTSLEKLGLWANKVSDISLVSSLTSLKSLDLAENKIRVLKSGVFKNLSQLEELVLDNNELASIKYGAFDGLTNLKNLHIEENSISDISEVSKLKNLEILYARDNKFIKNIKPLSNLKNLKELWLDGNIIDDITSLENLTELTWLKLDKNNLYSISSLRKLTKMEKLSVRGNKLKTLNGIENMSNLQWLEAEKNEIWDIKQVKALTKLTILELKNNKIENISAIEDLVNLTQLYLNNNEIKDISALSKLTKLKLLYLSRNKIKDYSPTKEYFNTLNRKDFTLN
ncbi:leucine-rich repeat domain-containing protein [Hathewaya massiliensis]|uniref:leucine-rich repeat domain-containing protein n=1 Tax=Hathewaya massiliensis TaxID=1964382 RepID=UPI00115B9384|nr:leucine-rich repeat domain-containing protein [Hathewaya massiliensis]